MTEGQTSGKTDFSEILAWHLEVLRTGEFRLATKTARDLVDREGGAGGAARQEIRKTAETGAAREEIRNTAHAAEGQDQETVPPLARLKEACAAEIVAEASAGAVKGAKKTRERQRVGRR